MRFAKTLLLLILVSPFADLAQGHDHWINHGGFRNKAGEYCCGENDCAAMDIGSVRITAGGYDVHGYGTINGVMGGRSNRIRVDETVPFSEVQRSSDGVFWRCHRPDGSRRCFFVPDQMM